VNYDETTGDLQRLSVPAKYFNYL